MYLMLREILPILTYMYLTNSIHISYQSDLQYYVLSFTEGTLRMPGHLTLECEYIFNNKHLD